MAKWFGKVGFAIQKESEPGIYIDEIVDREYYGNLHRNYRRLQSTSDFNDSVNVSNEISILADPYANENFHSIRYAEFMGTKWKVTTVDVQYPRLILSLGDVYNA